jgi:hypothetical protein
VVDRILPVCTEHRRSAGAAGSARRSPARDRCSAQTAGPSAAARRRGASSSGAQARTIAWCARSICRSRDIRNASP